MRKKIHFTENNYIGVNPNMTTKSVSFKKEYPFAAQIRVNGKVCNLGFFKTEREAALAYDRKAIELGRETNILKKKAA